jgi:hypothetical protein
VDYKVKQYNGGMTATAIAAEQADEEKRQRMKEHAADAARYNNLINMSRCARCGDTKKSHYKHRGSDFCGQCLRDTGVWTPRNHEKVKSEQDLQYGIRNLKKCKLGKKTTVELTDGREGTATVQGGDQYDQYVAFALAFTDAHFESKTAFHNFVNRIAKKNTRYGIFVKGKKLKPLK